MTGQRMWKLEHYELLHSHKTLDEAAKDFMRLYPEIPLSMVLNRWDHKTKSHLEHDHLKAEQNKPKPVITSAPKPKSAPMVTTQSERLKKMREIILSLNIKSGSPVPYEDIYMASYPTHHITIKSLQQLLTATGGYAKYSSCNIFADIIVKQPNGRFIYVSPSVQKAPEDAPKIMIPARIVHKFEKQNGVGAPASSFVEDDIMVVKNHNLRVEQNAILKEILSAILKQNDLVTKTMARFDEAIETSKKRMV
jgi:hypothetical protein